MGMEFTVLFYPKTEHYIISLIIWIKIQFNQRVTELEDYYLPVERTNCLSNMKNEENETLISQLMPSNPSY